ncbi:MAG TPA: HEAT repeat domain-containing protein [Gemmatimonadaceae bacterium]|nr:HEAT repeat domain-containing protein [Gemmatimonadaceae bacterium]
MDSAFAIRIEPLLLPGFAAMATLWLSFSGWVVADRVRYDRSRERLDSIERALADPTLATLPPLERAAAVRDMLGHLPTLDVYRMTGNADLPPWVREQCGAHALQQVGLDRMLRDATPHRGARRKWRRISALNALVYARPDSIHALLRVALADADADVASAAASVLQRLGDRRAAEVLIGGLRSSRLPASRIAARLERFPIAIDELLRPLLTSTRPEARYWAVTLLRGQHDHGGLADAIVPLVDDADPPVRKAALLTLAAMQAPDLVRLASWRLTDPAPYVRSAAILALAQAGERTPDRARRSALASTIAPSLADRDWSVRTAAKDALARLGPATWRAVAAQLSSDDRFARNGAAEVLQNLGVLDWTLRGIASGVRPSPEALDVLKRALLEGGMPMADAAMLRTKAEPIPSIDALLRSLELEEAAS